MWAKMAAGGDKSTFRHQIAMSNRALSAGVRAMAPIVRNPRGHFSKTQLRAITYRVAGAYRRSLRAQEAILLAKGREMVGLRHMKMPHGITSRKAIRKAVKKAKHAKAKAVRKILHNLRKISKKAAKKSIKKSAHKKGKKAKHVKRHARKAARDAVKKHMKKIMHKLVKKFGKKTAKKIAKHLKRAAARTATVVVHKVRRHRESKALRKLKNVGAKVANQITKETLAAHKSKAAATAAGVRAGRAAVQYAAILIKKQLIKKMGHKRTHALIKRVTAKANAHVHAVAAKRASGHNGKKPSKKALGQVMSDMMA
jgi:hypothetical protein